MLRIVDMIICIRCRIGKIIYLYVYIYMYVCIHVYVYVDLYIYNIYIYVVSLELWNPGISTRTTSCQNKTGHGFHKSHPPYTKHPPKITG